MMTPSIESQITVLIVEDEPFVRMSAVDIVEGAGFLAIEARNADQAIDILEARVDIRIVFTDIHMPGSMDGLKLAAAIRGRWPPIEIIVTSGLHRIGSTDLPVRGIFIAKPYDAQEVAEVLKRMTTRHLKTK